MSRTINELNTTDTLVGDDKLVIWKDEAGATRAITAADAADYFSLSGGPYQPLDELLTSIAALGPTTTADRMIYTTAQDVAALTPITAFGRSLLDDANAAAVFATLGADSVYARLAAPNTFTKGQTIDLAGSETTPPLDMDHGASGDPLTVDMRFGYAGSKINVWIDADGSLNLPGVDALAVGHWGEVEFRSGERGIATGIYGKGLCSGTWDPGIGFNGGAIGGFFDGSSARGGAIFGIGVHASATITAGALIRGGEFDTICPANTDSKIGIEVVSTAADTGVTTGIVTIDGGAALEDSAGIRLFAVTGGVGYSSGIMTIKRSDTAAPVKSGGALWHAGGFTTNAGLDWRSMTFSQAALWLKNNQNLTWRNAADNANIVGIKVDASNLVSIADAKLLVNPSTGASTLAGSFEVDATGSDAFIADRAAGSDAYYRLSSGGSNRWRFGKSSDAESGSNAGTNFQIIRYSDAGTFLGVPFIIARDTGYATIDGVYNSTTASAANVFVAAGGLLSRSTSALKYKKDVEPFDTGRTWPMLEAIDDALIWYRSNTDLCEGDDPRHGHYGVAADPLADVLPQLVHFGKSGEVEGFAYERVIVPLVRAVMELRKEVEQWKNMALNTLAPAGNQPSSSSSVSPDLSQSSSLEDDVPIGEMEIPEEIEIPRFLAPDPLEDVPASLIDLAEPGETVAEMQARLWELWREMNGKLMLNIATPEEIALHTRLHNELHWIAPPIEGE